MKLRARWARLHRSGQSGQALVEESVLLALLVGSLVAGGSWLLGTNASMIRALDASVRGVYFVLSLPIP